MLLFTFDHLHGVGGGDRQHCAAPCPLQLPRTWGGGIAGQTTDLVWWWWGGSLEGIILIAFLHLFPPESYQEHWKKDPGREILFHIRSNYRRFSDYVISSCLGMPSDPPYIWALSLTGVLWNDSWYTWHTSLLGQQGVWLCRFHESCSLLTYSRATSKNYVSISLWLWCSIPQDELCGLSSSRNRLPEATLHSNCQLATFLAQMCCHSVGILQDQPVPMRSSWWQKPSPWYMAVPCRFVQPPAHCRISLWCRQSDRLVDLLFTDSSTTQ